MATLMVKVCEECGKQSMTGDGWLVIGGIDIRSANTNEAVVRTEADTDLCSPGCVLRYISRHLEPAMNAHCHVGHPIRRATGPERAARIVA